MEASTYVWAVILTFFILYGMVQLRKCFLQILSSGARNTPSNRLSRSSVYTIESDATARPYGNDQESLRSVNNGPIKKKDDLPTYEEVIASDRLNPINCLSSTSELYPSSVVRIHHGSINATASNAAVDR
ncbi:hypothetical protein Bhyg_17745 [Pseudolycoriella hygida]|uniref:Uncharacterized protein n=1 Tax=Pseudolycoriella hygida TaxID=35572 RepID=A0A9Q0MI47_9DIPT|nr:hypothetical protein Bhyg_17745 [Pseudolycoriella hygida]